MTTPSTSHAANGAEHDRLVGWMPFVVRSAGLTEWERTFCVSLIAKSRNPRFVPSEKQVRVMTRLVDAFLKATLVEDEPGTTAADPERAVP